MTRPWWTPTSWAWRPVIRGLVIVVACVLWCGLLSLSPGELVNVGEDASADAVAAPSEPQPELDVRTRDPKSNDEHDARP